MEGSGQHHAPSALPRGKSSQYPMDRGWIGPRAGLDAEEKRKIFCPCLDSNAVCPASNLSLYRSGQAYRLCSFVVYLLELSATQAIFRRMITCQWIRNSEGWGGKRSWPIVSSFPVFAWGIENWGKASDGEPEAPGREANAWAMSRPLWLKQQICTKLEPDIKAIH
jgi:hypothetical protein